MDPIAKPWEALVLASLPILVTLILVLQAYDVSRVITGLLFVLIPFAFFPTMFVGDQVRNRIIGRLAHRRIARQQRREEQRRRAGR